MTSTSSVVQHLIPALADVLGRIAKTPGRRESWPEPVLRTLEEHEPNLSERIRRRIGFARRLGELCGLDLLDQAAADTGLLFHELIAAAPTPARRGHPAARGWADYLVSCVDWLAPTFRVTDALRSPDWDEGAGRAEIVARITVAFDVETFDRHRRPLQIVQGLMDEATSPEAQEILSLFWTEDGQELCDHHFRRRHEGYSVDGSYLRQELAELKRNAPRRSVEDETEALAPTRWSGPARAQPERPRQTRGAGDAADNFERRRQALRSANRAPAEREEPAAPEPEDRPAIWVPAAYGAGDATASAPLDTEEERQMDNIRSISEARPAGNAAEFAEQLDDLRRQLDQIQIAAAEGQRLLGQLGPELERFAGWLSDLEGVVGRWKDSGREAA